MKTLVIGASWFLVHGYCEYKVYLQKVLRIHVPETEAMTEGLLVHQIKEEEFIKEAELVTWEELLSAEQLTITREVFLQKNIGDVVLLGKVDEIASDKDVIYIIEDKPRAYPFSSVKRQIAAYCYLFKETFSCSKKLVAVLRDRDNGEIVWKQEYNNELENEFLMAFHRLRRILFGEEEPIPTSNPNKCGACQFNKVCENSLAK